MKTRQTLENDATAQPLRSGAMVLLRDSTAEEILHAWEEKRDFATREKHAPMDGYRSPHNYELWAVREAALDECIKDMRRLLEPEEVSQPQENTEVRHARANHP